MRDDARQMFAHVFWIGGPSDAGKSTVARLLAEQDRWQIYPCDFHEHNHFIARTDPQQQPVMYQWTRLSPEEQWIETTPEALFDNVLASNDERFPMILDDLRAMPPWPPILVEGPRLFPKLVAPLLTDPHQAIWLLPSAQFARQSIARRDKPQGRYQTRDPERYRDNFLGRDTLVRAYIEREVMKRDLPLLAIDGSQTVAETVARVAAHFAPYVATLMTGQQAAVSGRR